jgi:phosphate transport system substrate-binding protein
MAEAKEKGIEYIELPVAFDALTVVVNPKNTFVDNLTVAELKKLWEPDAQGKVTSWRQVRAGFPDKPVTLFGAGSDSGTFDYFTEAIVGKSKSSRGDYTASEDDNTLVQGVHKDPSALGYFGYAYYAENEGKLRSVPIVNAAGEAIQPSKESVMNGSYTPLSRPVYIYVNKKSLEKESVQKFVRYYLTHAAKVVDEVKYIPLPASAYEQGLSRLEALKTGTAFGGRSEAGLHVDELFSRPLTDTPPVEKTDHK